MEAEARATVIHLLLAACHVAYAVNAGGQEPGAANANAALKAMPNGEEQIRRHVDEQLEDVSGVDAPGADARTCNTQLVAVDLTLTPCVD
ncbi:hypothetical protein [Paraburkholderia sp. SIMBA_030]|uniref:hypothetical protein n=1 Tax=Paraburkholderia sp. SIMBA_030 TaxID=3085773 RepID=UPI00397A1AF2